MVEEIQSVHVCDCESRYHDWAVIRIMWFGDTLSEDQFSGYQFQYIISNPPFGIDWKREKAAVEKAEAKKGDLGRFSDRDFRKYQMGSSCLY